MKLYLTLDSLYLIVRSPDSLYWIVRTSDSLYVIVAPLTAYMEFCATLDSVYAAKTVKFLPLTVSVGVCVTPDSLCRIVCDP